MPERSNSFAHEWAHALDHYLSDQLTASPVAKGMLSRDTRAGQNALGAFTHPDTASAFANLINAIYHDQAGMAAKHLELQIKASATDKSGNLTPAALRAQTQIDRLTRGGSTLQGFESDYWKRVGQFSPGNPGYWRNPAEMLARTFEMFTAHKMDETGGDNSFVTKGDRAYQETGDRRLDLTFPKADDLVNIIRAWNEVNAALQREQVLGPGTPALKPTDYNIADPRHWDKYTPVLSTAGQSIVRREINAFKNFSTQFRDRLGFSPGRPFSGPNMSVTRRITDPAKAIFYSIRGMVESMKGAYTDKPAVQKAIQGIMDKLSPEPGSGRYVGETYTDKAKHRANTMTRRYVNILNAHGLDDMNAYEGAMLRHVLSTGEGDAAGAIHQDGTRIPDNITKAAGQIRGILNAEWKHNHDAGINLGWSAGYFPRMTDVAAVHANVPGFFKAAMPMYARIFEDDVGQPGTANHAQALLDAHDELGRDVLGVSQKGEDSSGYRPGMDPDDVTKIAELRKNLRRQDDLASQLTTGVHNDPVAGQLELTKLRADAQSLAGQLHDPVRDNYAASKAQNWLDRINIGNPTDYDTRGPASSYTKNRVLPGYADQMMKDFMVTDPNQAIPTYLEQSARRTAFAEAFQADGSGLNRMIAEASRAGLRGEDANNLRGYVELVTGRHRSGTPSNITTGLNFLHATGTVTLMPRAAATALAEPTAMWARTGSFKAMMHTWGSIVGDVFRTDDAKMRGQLAQALGVITSSMHDSIIKDRMNGGYNDMPRTNKFLTHYYRRIGMTELVNAQRRASLTGAHIALQAWSQDVLAAEKELNPDLNKPTVPAPGTAPNPRLSVNTLGAGRDGMRQLAELGVPPEQVFDFARWITENDRMPSIEDLQTPGGRVWGLAASRLIEQANQDPGVLDKPLMASTNPLGRLAFGLMGFNYSFMRNILLAGPERYGHSVKGRFTEARDRGQGVLSSALTSSPKALGGAVGAAGAVAAMWLSQLPGTIAREAAFNGDTWDEKKEKGELGEWLADLAYQRTGMNGTFDPLMQAINGLKYQRDLTALTAGAQVGNMLSAGQNMAQYFAKDRDINTNTAEFNSIQGALNLLGVPMAAYALTAIPGGPLVSAGLGLGMMASTSRQATKWAAGKVVGPKGSRVTPLTPDEEVSQIERNADDEAGVNTEVDDPLKPPAQADQSSGIGSKLLPFADDALPYAARGGAALAQSSLGNLTLKALGALPGPVKVGAAVLGAGYAAHKLWPGQTPTAPPPRQKPH